MHFAIMEGLINIRVLHELIKKNYMKLKNVNLGYSLT